MKILFLSKKKLFYAGFLTDLYQPIDLINPHNIHFKKISFFEFRMKNNVIYISCNRLYEK
jgi:hypothetical protein